MEKQQLAPAAEAIGDSISSALRDLQRSNGSIGDVRGLGAMQAMEFVVPGSTDPDPAAAAAVTAACLAAGVVVLTCGTWGNVVRLLPPLTISNDLLDDALGVIAEAVESSVA